MSFLNHELAFVAAAAKDEIDGCAESNEQTDSDLGSRLEKTNISQRSTSEVDTTQDNGSYLRTSSEPGSGTRVLMFENIKHFDIVSDPSDHHYITETAQVNDIYCLFASICRI